MARRLSMSLAVLGVFALAASPATAQQVTVLIDGSGAGPTAPLQSPWKIAEGADGSTWTAGQSSENVFRIDADGTIEEVFALWPRLREPTSVVVDATGNVFVTANGNEPGVLRIAPDGTVKPVVFEDGAGPGQTLDGVAELAVDAAGNVYVTGRFSDNLLRVEPSGTVTELVGPAGAGPGQELDEARAVAVDAAGNAYVTGMTSDNVLRVSPAGVVTEVVGPAGDGAGTALNGASAVAVAPDGTLYVASAFTHAVLERAPDGTITTLVDSSGDGAGNTLLVPQDLALASDGTLYVAGLASDNVFSVSPAGVVTEIADLSGDGAGNALDDPSDLVLTSDDALLVACGVSDLVFEIDAGVVTLAQSVPGFGDLIGNNGGIALDALDRLVVAAYDADEVVRFEPGGPVTLLDDSGGPGSALAQPHAVAVDSFGRAAVTSLTTSRVYRVDPADPDTLELVVGEDGGGFGLEDPEALVYDDADRLYVAGRDSDNVLRVDPDGTVIEILGPEGAGPGQPAEGPTGIALGDDGTLYVASVGSKRVFSVTPDGVVEEIANVWQVDPGASPNGGSWVYDIDVDPLGRVFMPAYIYGEVYRADPDGTLELIWSQQSTTVSGVAVDDGGTVYVGLGSTEEKLVRIRPSGAADFVWPASAPEGLVNSVNDLALRDPSHLDIASGGAGTVVRLDLELCGAWTLLPGALPDDGTAPVLTGEGDLCEQTELRLEVTKGRANTIAQLVIGLSQLDAPFKGGTLIPSPWVILPIPLDGDGAASLPATWPSGVPSSSLWLQLWGPDPGAGSGWVASNGLRLDVF